MNINQVTWTTLDLTLRTSTPTRGFSALTNLSSISPWGRFFTAPRLKRMPRPHCPHVLDFGHYTAEATKILLSE
ncbi:hypothetical protein TNCV_101971 [Trichonephila clavipes]|nr:hypothetical protein TNCV_101971 [Trichonephila clavipes]